MGTSTRPHAARAKETAWRRLLLRLAIASAACLEMTAILTPACATDRAAQGEDEIVWPLPPDLTRVRFIKSYRGSLDVTESDVGLIQQAVDVITEILFGKARPVGIKKPYGVFADARGRVFVSDTGWGKVLVFDEERRSFEVWGQGGSGTLKRPLGITGDDAGNVFVADLAMARVVGFTPEGKFLRAYGRSGELEGPVGVAVDAPRGLLYVVDTKLHQLVVFDLETTKRVRVIGKRGDSDSAFNMPTNVAVAADGTVFVMDTFNFKVKVFDTKGKLLRSFGCNGAARGCFARSKGIGIDSDGHVYVADAAFNAVQIFDPKGQLLLLFGSGGHGPGELWLPAGLYIDKRDRIYVADQYNYRVNIYQYVSQPEEERDPEGGGEDGGLDAGGGDSGPTASADASAAEDLPDAGVTTIDGGGDSH